MHAWRRPLYGRLEFWSTYMFWLLADGYLWSLLWRAPRQDWWSTTGTPLFLVGATFATAVRAVLLHERLRRLVSDDAESPIEDQVTFLRLAARAVELPGSAVGASLLLAVLAIANAYSL